MFSDGRMKMEMNNKALSRKPPNIWKQKYISK